MKMKSKLVFLLFIVITISEKPMPLFNLKPRSVVLPNSTVETQITPAEPQITTTIPSTSEVEISSISTTVNNWLPHKNITHLLINKNEIVENVGNTPENEGLLQRNPDEAKDLLIKIERFNLPEDNECPNIKYNLPISNIRMQPLLTKVNFHQFSPTWTKFFESSVVEKFQKRQVTVVLHSHTDAGSAKTFEEYYQDQVGFILSTFNEMHKYPTAKAIWNDIAYLSEWWKKSDLKTRKHFTDILDRKQIEITSGGWVMPDEATTHWTSLLVQLTVGHQWIAKTFKIIPEHAWSVDTFGYSPTMAYLYKLSGIKSIFLVRIHEAIKNQLAMYQSLEFFWRQSWDSEGKYDIFVHVHPYHTHTTDHSCGADAQICRELNFDEGYAHSELSNVERVKLMIKSYKGAASYFRGARTVIPLGGDFLYSFPESLKSQAETLQKLFTVINKQSETNLLQVRFGTLHDYYGPILNLSLDELHKYPTYIGDFFTYANHIAWNSYWTGFYSLRPLYKEWDRTLIHYIRSTEILMSIIFLKKHHDNWLYYDGINELRDAMENYSIFQHHDGITGTSAPHVVLDYQARLFDATIKIQRIFKYCIQLLLSVNRTFPYDENSFYEFNEQYRNDGKLPEKLILFKNHHQQELIKITIFNSLFFERNQLINLRVATPYLIVKNSLNEIIITQINPIMDLNGIDFNYYEVIFNVTISPISIVTFTINKLTEKFNYLDNIMAKLEFYNTKNIKKEIIKYSKIMKPNKKIILKNHKLILKFNENGLLHQLVIDNNTYPLEINFFYYESKNSAYLFNPNYPAKRLELINPVINVIRGSLSSSVTLNYVNEELTIKHTVTLTNNFGIQIDNYVFLKKQSNKQIVMHIKTGVDNKGEFFTDLNGFQILQRRVYSKLKIGGNYYPVSNVAYIQDNLQRVTIISKAPHGIGFLQNGEMEIMLERHATDSKIGGIVDESFLTHHQFQLIFEQRFNTKWCKSTLKNHPSGFVSVTGHLLSITMQNPFIVIVEDFKKRHYKPSEILNHFEFKKNINFVGIDVFIAAIRPLVFLPQFGDDENVGIIVHQTLLDTCLKYDPELELFHLQQHYPLNLTFLLDDCGTNCSIMETTLTFTQTLKQKSNLIIDDICPMDIRGYAIRITENLKSVGLNNSRRYYRGSNVHWNWNLETAESNLISSVNQSSPKFQFPNFNLMIFFVILIVIKGVCC